jgi:phosphoglycolate phosphatase-like HAD superfamily hydrolase
MYKLIIFDVDDTLVEGMEGDRFPSRVVEKLLTIPADTQIALAHNAGGVNLRWWIENSGGFGRTPEEKAQSLLDAQRYPTVESTYLRLSRIAGEITMLTGTGVKIYACFAYQTKSGKWAPTPYGTQADMTDLWSSIDSIPLEWNAFFRKPNPGMLVKAIADANVDRRDTLFVGDLDSDWTAAAAADCDFMWAKDYFGG